MSSRIEAKALLLPVVPALKRSFSACIPSSGEVPRYQTSKKCKRSGTVLAYGVKSAQGGRSYQEDAWLVQSDLLGENHRFSCSEVGLASRARASAAVHCAAVFDGHGGSVVAQHCVNHLPTLLRAQLMKHELQHQKQQQQQPQLQQQHCIHQHDQHQHPASNRFPPGDPTALPAAHEAGKSTACLATSSTTGSLLHADTPSLLQQGSPSACSMPSSTGQNSPCSHSPAPPHVLPGSHTVPHNAACFSPLPSRASSTSCDQHHPPGNTPTAAASLRQQQQQQQQASQLPEAPSSERAAAPRQLQPQPQPQVQHGLPADVVAAALRASFLECDAAVPHPTGVEAGSTAVCALLTHDAIHVANCGDSRAVLARCSGAVVALSDDHKPERPDELARIEAAGGQVLWNGGHRVMGVLAMTRAIGDTCLRSYGVTALPDITSTPRSPDDDFLILATDGLWNVMTNERSVEVARACIKRALLRRADRRTALNVAAQVLVKAALQAGSNDNITALVIDLQQPNDSGSQAAPHYPANSYQGVPAGHGHASAPTSPMADDSPSPDLLEGVAGYTASLQPDPHPAPCGGDSSPLSPPASPTQCFPCASTPSPSADGFKQRPAVSRPSPFSAHAAAPGSTPGSPTGVTAPLPPGQGMRATAASPPCAPAPCERARPASAQLAPRPLGGGGAAAAAAAAAGGHSDFVELRGRQLWGVAAGSAAPDAALSMTEGGAAMGADDAGMVMSAASQAAALSSKHADGSGDVDRAGPHAAQQRALRTPVGAHNCNASTGGSERLLAAFPSPAVTHVRPHQAAIATHQHATAASLATSWAAPAAHLTTGAGASATSPAAASCRAHSTPPVLSCISAPLLHLSQPCSQALRAHSVGWVPEVSGCLDPLMEKLMVAVSMDATRPRMSVL